MLTRILRSMVIGQTILLPIPARRDPEKFRACVSRTATSVRKQTGATLLVRRRDTQVVVQRLITTDRTSGPVPSPESDAICKLAVGQAIKFPWSDGHYTFGHWERLQNIVRYLRRTRGLKLRTRSLAPGFVVVRVA